MPINFQERKGRLDHTATQDKAWKINQVATGSYNKRWDRNTNFELWRIREKNQAKTAGWVWEKRRPAQKEIQAWIAREKWRVARNIQKRLWARSKEKITINHREKRNRHPEEIPNPIPTKTTEIWRKLKNKKWAWN